MVCEKCTIIDKKEETIFGRKLCQICSFFAPEDESNFNSYLNEKIDWKVLETFRKYGQMIGKKQKKGMETKAKEGGVMSRPPLGYSLVDSKLIENGDSSRVHSLFKKFLETDISLNKLSKEYSLSVNGLKKVLTNRTYLGEVKFNGQIFKGTHKPIISSEIFYAVQRKLHK